jgi:hypothetical protein
MITTSMPVVVWPEKQATAYSDWGLFGELLLHS